MPVGKLRQTLGLRHAVFASMRCEEIGDVLRPGAPDDDKVREERPALSREFVGNGK